MSSSFTFGIYPGSGVGAENGLVTGPADIPEQIRHALDTLQPPNKPFRVRAYIPYVGDGKVEAITPEDFVQYVGQNRLLDLVLCYRANNESLDCWTEFIRKAIRQYSPYVATLQITEEPNSTGPGGDGISPNVRAALVAGVLAAKAALTTVDEHIKVGFSATINFNPADDFWPEIRQLGGQSFVDALDYVALDFFPDVFSPLPPNMSVADAVRNVLHQFRHVNLPEAGISANTPIIIGENGWPTSPTRSYKQQADVLERIIRTIHQHRNEFNIIGYSLFDLRDADSSQDNIFYQFGLLRDDYSPKPACEIFRKLVSELTI